MARRTLLTLQLLTVFAPACPAPDDDEFGGTALLVLGDFSDSDDRATTSDSDARATTEPSAPPDAPECGDGHLDPGESCDLGDANADDGDCTPECRLPTCGDGLLHPATEQCDLGDANADHGPCTSDCRLPTCGDGLLHPATEQCDLGDANADDGPCTTQCRLAVCGDGLVHTESEECDLGLGENSPTGACTPQCKLAVCGDGLVHAGHEECDLGLAGNGPDYGGCRPDCTLGPRCGDLIVQPEHEECDEGHNNGAGLSTPDGAPCDAGCRRAARLVFITAATFQGDLGGLDGADLECQNAAKNARLPDYERFRAWLADDTGSPLTRFDPGQPAVPYVLVNGLRVADNFDDLITHGPQRGIDITETGEQLPTQRPVWTNTSFTGAAFDPDAHCNRWTSSSPSLPPPRIGLASAPAEAQQVWKADRLFTTWNHSACASAWRLYCFEQ